MRWLIISGTWWYWVSIWQYWLVLDQYKLVLLDIRWYRVSKGLVCLYILEKVEIWSGVTDASQTHRQQKIELLSFSTVSSLSWVTQINHSAVDIFWWKLEQPKSVTCTLSKMFQNHETWEFFRPRTTLRVSSPGGWCDHSFLSDHDADVVGGDGADDDHRASSLCASLPGPYWIKILY